MVTDRLTREEQFFFLTGFVLVGVGILANEWILVKFSSDGVLDPITRVQIWVADLTLILIGTLLIKYKSTKSLVGPVSYLLAGYGGVHVLFVMFLWLNHIAFPLNLEAMELPVLQHLRRVMNGHPLYAEPTPEFVALAYNPLYYFFAVPFAWLFGANLFTLRLVAIIGMAGAGVMIFLATRQMTGSNWWGLIGMGLFAAAYRVMDTYLDNAHSDSWLLFTVLLGCYLISLQRSRLTDFLGVFFLVISFWFKQHGALFTIGGVVYLTWREGWRKAWPFWLLATVLGPVLYFMAPAWLFGPKFHYFTWEVPRRWTELNLATINRLLEFIARTYFILAGIGIIFSTLMLWRKRHHHTLWHFMLLIAILSGLMGAFDPGSNNNVFIPLGVWFILTGVVGLKMFADYFPAARLRGIHLAILGAAFATMYYNPMKVIVSPQAPVAYQDLISYLNSLNGPVYAPWLGQLPDGYELSPSAHWVPIEDLIRQPGTNTHNHPTTRKLLKPVVSPERNAYILTNIPLEDDPLLRFLTQKYVFERDLKDRFVALKTLPKRYDLGWPRFLYRYAPEETTTQSTDMSN